MTNNNMFVGSTTDLQRMLLNKDDGGAIALLTTTRPVFSQTNFRLNNQFYKNVFNKVNGEYLRLGDIFRITKNKSLSGPINRNFSLLGDPSLKLSYPSYSIKTNSIDTLKDGKPGIFASKISPGNTEPTPSGVPVKSKSPGRRVK